MRLILVFVLLIDSLFLSAQLVTNESFSSVNSTYNELNPILSPDGNTLYVTIANHPANIGGVKDPGDIWQATWTPGGWSKPVHAGNVVNDKAYNAVAGLSPGGDKLFILNHFNRNGELAKTQGISVCKRTDGGWSHPENINIPYFLNRSSFHCGTISQDLKVFIFSAETYGTHGVDDLYLSVNENGAWSEPMNLGVAVNTQLQEVSPFLSADGKTLYFSSNGRKGSGSFDVYATTRLDDSWTTWSAPVNMGAAVNSDGRELFYTDYPTLGFSLYTTTKDSDAYGNLRIHRYNDPLPVDTVMTFVAIDTVSERETITEVVPKEKPMLTAKVYGRVTNAKTGEVVPATLVFAGHASREEMNARIEGAGYEIDIKPADSYVIRIEAPGFISALERLDASAVEMKEIEMNFSLQPVEVGTTVNLKSVLFMQTKTDLLPESYDELDLVVSFLKHNPNVNIELSGHTDNRGVHGDNVRLSQLRVNSVKQYLVSKGIDAKRISGKGYGGTKPIASNDTEETRRMNRRVEFTIKKF